MTRKDLLEKEEEEVRNNFTHCLICDGLYFKLEVIPFKMITCLKCTTSYILSEINFDVINSAMIKEERNKKIMINKTIFEALF